MFKLKRIIYILMMTIVILTSFSIFSCQNKAKAVVLPTGKIDLYSKGKANYFNYNGKTVEMEVVFHKRGGVENPAYSLSQTKTKFSAENDYDVKIDRLETNQKVWKAITNGYPFKTLEDLNCSTINQAYAATQMAVYDAIYTYDLSKITPATDDDANTVEIAKKIINEARSQTKTKKMAQLKLIEDSSNWKVDDANSNYVTKTYTVSSSAPIQNYKAYITGEDTKDAIITDENVVSKFNFEPNEKFKVAIPVSRIPNTVEFRINITSSLQTYPVYHAKDSENTYEDFAIIIGEYESAEATFAKTVEINKTKIKILKQDGDSQKPLQGAVFNLLDKNKSILYSELITNSKGIIEISDLLPDIYYLEEVIAPNGYYGYEELIKIDTTAKETVEVVVDNFIDEGEKVVPEEPKQEHFSNKKLPVTGF